jgi:hypothetical protein
MDKPNIRLLATEDPELFFQNYPPPLIIDEIQYSPQLFSYIKMLIDEKRNINNHFILTGSQIFPLMAKVSESLAGRIAVFTLLPLSLREKYPAYSSMTLSGLKTNILRGGFPQISLSRTINPEVCFSIYLQTYLERDIRQLRHVADLGDFQKFLQLLAANNGQALNLSTLSRDLGIAVNTVKGWISLLEASGQIISLKPFYINKGKRIIKSPKIYFVDTGLLCYLTGLDSVDQIFKGPFSGQMYETIVLSELLKYFYSRGIIPRVYWWRTSSGDEVDFIIELKGRIIPVEVKLSANATMEMAKGLTKFRELFADRIDHAYIVNLSLEKQLIDRTITALPLFKFINTLDTR